MKVLLAKTCNFSAFQDSSGVRLTYTPTLREQDVGSIQVGMVQGVVVPPRVDKFKVEAYCDSTCTQQVCA